MFCRVMMPKIALVFKPFMRILEAGRVFCYIETSRNIS